MARFLIIIPYPFYPPNFGGALRCYHILNEVSKQHEVNLLTVHSRKDFDKYFIPAFPKNIRILSTEDEKKWKSVFNLLPKKYANAINSRIIQRNLLKTGNQFLLNAYLILKKFLTEEQVDYIIYENTQCYFTLFPTINRFNKTAKHIYDAHNVDSELMRQAYLKTGKKDFLETTNQLIQFESDLYNRFSLILCCSEKDKEKFDESNKHRANTVVVPNGVDTSVKAFDTNPQKHAIRNLLFCGTLNYEPNIEAVFWFYDKILPIIHKRYPDITFTIIGKMGLQNPFEKILNDPKVHFIGQVEEVTPYYKNSSVLVVPLKSGSGTRLKILESMSLGTAVVSTSLGAEGILAKHKSEIIIADSESEFLNAILQLIENPIFYHNLRSNARDLVLNKFDWNLIGETLNSSLNEI